MAWGDMQHFHESTATLNPWFPKEVRPAVGILLAAIEITLGVALDRVSHSLGCSRKWNRPSIAGLRARRQNGLVQTLTESGKRTFEARRGSR